MKQETYALSATVFALVFLGSVIVYGSETARHFAVAASLAATASQFTAQDPLTYRLSIWSAYSAFALALVALATF
ncbi:hypothetical protein [Erwinia amylovora]|uniref:hypothetical protein n=1 Tax=Erwinia amylovora TaxID=552 RepID=UPI003D05F355